VKTVRTRLLVGALAAMSCLAMLPAAAVADPLLMRPRRPDGGPAPGGALVSSPAHVLPAVVPIRDSLTRALGQGRISEARYALLRARSLFHPERVRAEFGRILAPAGDDATMILRDLALRMPELSAADATQARAILARPDDGSADPNGDGYTVTPAGVTCGTDVCVHWVGSSDDAPDLTDADLNSTPDWVDTTLATMEEVWLKEVTEGGYRPPKPDLTSTNHGPDGKLDVYVADLGDDGLYGYCTTDDPNAVDPGTTYEFVDFSAYCVLDDDYAPAQFGTVTNGVAALQVTAAHEFFHAVQFAYDAAEDLWLMEGTATWMEDEVYDDVDDNLQFLASSPLRQPSVPLDLGKKGYEYGAWIFWRFLSEYFGPDPSTPDPTIVRRIWELADGSSTGPNRYSLQAATIAAGERNQSFRHAFADFGAWNAMPRGFYSEGGSYPTPKPADSWRLTERRVLTGGQAVRLDHLTDAYVEFRPGRGIRRTATLGVVISPPKYPRGPEATLLVVYRSGKILHRPYQLPDTTFQRVPFGPGKVARVVLVLTNASTRFACWQNHSYSCRGQPRDDDQVFGYAAGVSRG
jgi:hypothetical protein